MVLLRPLVLGCAFTAAGCSVVLDPDQIDAQRLAAGDTATASDTVSDSAATDVAATTTSDATAPVDTAGAVTVHYQGEGDCVLDYRIVPISSCPETCPAGGWSLVFEASSAVSHTYAWQFSATENYRVATRNLSGARVTMKLDVPSCALLQGAAVGPAKVLAELSVDGGPYDLVATLDFAVAQETTCNGSGACPGP